MHMFYNGMNGWDYGYGGWFDWMFSTAIWVVLIALLVILIVRLNRKHMMMGNHETPLDILKKRYANGEIDKKEYEEKKKELS